MSITIKFPNQEIDCGYIHFKFLRDSIAKKIPHKGFQEVLKLRDDNLVKYMFCFSEEKKKQKKEFYDDLNKKINDIDYLANADATEEEKKYLDLFQEFFWASDCGAKMSASVAKAIWHYIEDMDDDFELNRDGETFQDFKSGIEECVYTNKGFEWC